MKVPLPPRPALQRHLNINKVAALALLLAVFLVPILAFLQPHAKAQNQAVPAAQIKKAEFAPGELLVRFRPGTTVAKNRSRAQLSMTSGSRSLRVEVNHFGGSDLVEGLMLARVSPENTLDALKALRSRADVLYVEPNFIRHLDVVPNDSFYGSQWPLKNSSAGGGGISAEAAWDTTTGSQNVVVGVIDTGIDIGHRDLKDNIFVNTAEIPGNNIDDDNNGYIDDVNGWDFISHDKTVFDNADDDSHGTHVAGIIGARGNNSAGIAGVNWNVQLMPLKALGPLGGTDASLLEAYNYAKMMRQRGVNLRVLNNSYGGQQFSQSLLDAIKQLNDAGILFVAAAGNETLNNDFVPHFPATYDVPNVISVAASTQSGFFAFTFSNRGQQTVHLVAPGDGVLSTTPHGYIGDGLVAANTDADGSTYSVFSGTSMASPHVAGAAALACAANPSVSLEKLRASVLFGVDDSANLGGMVMTGGRLNANKTVQLALENDSSSPAAAANFHIASQNGRRIELRWNEAGDDGSIGRASLDEIRFTDSVSGEQFPLNFTRSLDPGTERIVFVSTPLRHPTGQLMLRTFDNAGNSSTTSINVSVPIDVADPYIVTTGAPAALTAPNTGNSVGAKGDDVISQIHLPFPFPFFGFVTDTAYVSSNGALYVPVPPDFTTPNPNGFEDAAIATTANLKNLAMIAGMWADLRTDRNATDNVYMVTPDIDRVILRWQAVTFGSETPVNFEIELRRDGSIQTRYGSGNQNLNPVIVGISGGDPDAYLVSSHSSESAPLSLTNAQTVTFALRNPPPAPTTDLAVSMTANPTPVISGQNVTYSVSIVNLGPSMGINLVMTDVLSPGTTFVSCTSNFINATCTGPAVGTTGTVTGRINELQPTPSNSGIGFTIVANVTAPPGSTIQNTATATSFRPDPNTSNNSATVTSAVVLESFFGAARGVSAGNSHTTSVRNDGTVWDWGTGFNGQLGNGTNGNGVRTLTPVQVSGLEGITQVADGNTVVYALKSDGTVWAWGYNGQGGLGDGTTTDRSRPVQTLGLTNVKAVAAGMFYGAAVKNDGTVWLWGGSIVSNTFVINTTPVQLNGISNVSAIAAGGNHLLMLKTDKTVWAVGGNSRGELGDGTTTNRLTPVQVNGLSNVARIAAGRDEFSMALKEDGTIWAWGINFSGELGPGGGKLDFDPHPNPIQVTGLPAGMKEIAAGTDFCLAIANDGTIWSWGNNGHSQLGQGSQVGQNPIPAQIPNFGNVVAVAGGWNHSVALKSDGSVWSWGWNFEGECGDGTTTTRSSPVKVSGLETVGSPLLNPPGGSFFGPFDVTITSATPGTTIHFTTNGMEPTESDAAVPASGIVHLTQSTFLLARAWKPGLVPSSTVSGTYDVTIVTTPPTLIMEQNGPTSNQLAAVDAVMLLRDPFPVVNPANLLKHPNDPNTRVIVFASTVPIGTNETAAAVTVRLTDANNAVYNVPAEGVTFFPNVGFSQVVFRLPNLPQGQCQVQLIVHNLMSNVGVIRIQP